MLLKLPTIGLFRTQRNLPNTKDGVLGENSERLDIRLHLRYSTGFSICLSRTLLNIYDKTFLRK